MGIKQNVSQKQSLPFSLGAPSNIQDKGYVELSVLSQDSQAPLCERGSGKKNGKSNSGEKVQQTHPSCRPGGEFPGIYF